MTLGATAVSTYVHWGAGLRGKPPGDWKLLEQTANKHECVSKAAYDLAKLRPGSRRIQRIAAAAGYLGTELAKEAPYYAGPSAPSSSAIQSHRPMRDLSGGHESGRWPRTSTGSDS